MKTNTLALLTLSAVALSFAGCTTTTRTTAQQERRDVEITSEKRSYSQAELQKRGRSNVGEALEAQDASVYISGRR